MRLSIAALPAAIFISAGSLLGQQPHLTPEQTAVPSAWRNAMPKTSWTMPLYDGPIPNSKPTPDEEKPTWLFGWPFTVNISRPTLTVYLPAPDKSIGSSVIMIPGGGYVMEGPATELKTDAERLQDRGVAVFVVKYRLPSPSTMIDPSIGPLQDAQQAIKMVRAHAAEWNIDPAKVGVMGFSAGGHLAATVGTHFPEASIPNDNHLSLRPDFMILVYPVITMMGPVAQMGSRKALLGENPRDEVARMYSNELKVTDETPPTLLLHAADDHIVDVDNSIVFFEALRKHKVPVEMKIFARGDHGFVLLTRDEWFEPILDWMTHNGWMKP
jgi:acetyl esterase/lipase